MKHKENPIDRHAELDSASPIRTMKKLLFIILLLFSKSVFAQEVFFDFSLKSPLISSGSKFEVTFNYQLEGVDERSFIIRPVVDRGIVEVWDEENDVWVSSYVLRSDLPRLSREVVVRIRGLKSGGSNLSFEVQNLPNGDIYKTPTRQVWNNQVYANYVERLNESLKRFVGDKMVE